MEIIFKTTTSVLKKKFGRIFSHDTFLYMLFVFGYNFGYKNKYLSTFSRLYCLSYLVCVCHQLKMFLEQYPLNDLKIIATFVFEFSRNVFVLIFIIITSLTKLEYLAKYFNDAKIIQIVIGSDLVQRSFSFTTAIFLYLVISKVWIVFVIFQFGIHPFSVEVIFKHALLVSAYMICMPVVFKYEILWLQLNSLKKMLNIDIKEKNAWKKNNSKILMKFFYVYRNIMRNIDVTSRVIKFQVRKMIGLRKLTYYIHY